MYIRFTKFKRTVGAELNNFKKHNNVENLKKELEREREDNRVLREKLKQKQKATSSKLQRYLCVVAAGLIMCLIIAPCEYCANH